MPATLVIQSSASFATPTGGSETIGPITVTGTIVPQRQSVNLVISNNTITVPTSAVGVIINPPSSNTVLLKYKTTSGDTGVALPQASTGIILFDTAGTIPTSIIINAASATTGNTQIEFF